MIGEITGKGKLPIKSWCENIEDSAMAQAVNLANHSRVFGHVALMPDCHTGYGMPIGGVIACDNAVIPNAVGVDIGCGMGAVETDLQASSFAGKKEIRAFLDKVEARVPAGEGHAHGSEQKWDGFERYLDGMGELPGWMDDHMWKLAKKNLGTLGGGNHFLEIQKDENSRIWLMLHSGSRNLGYKIAEYYNGIARNDDGTDLAWLPAGGKKGLSYIRDMMFALDYARENRNRMMTAFKNVFTDTFPHGKFIREINIHHNYAALENHFGRDLWVHRKGATSAFPGEPGIIPGSMGTPSYIVEGLGNPLSFMSCSHGAGRTMSRMQACRDLTVEQCDDAMGDVVFSRWQKLRGRGKKNSGLFDLGESPLAYKDIDGVIRSELDLIKPVVKLTPIGVIKG